MRFASSVWYELRVIRGVLMLIPRFFNLPKSDLIDHPWEICAGSLGAGFAKKRGLRIFVSHGGVLPERIEWTRIGMVVGNNRISKASPMSILNVHYTRGSKSARKSAIAAKSLLVAVAKWIITGIWNLSRVIGKIVSIRSVDSLSRSI